MKYIKTYNESLIKFNKDAINKPRFLSNLFNRDNTVVESYIRIFQDKEYDLNIILDSSYRIYKYSFSINNQDIEFQSGQYGESEIEVDGRKLSVSCDLMVTLRDLIRKVYARTMYLLKYLDRVLIQKEESAHYTQYHTGEPSKEIIDRSIEFEIVKDGELDLISLNQLYDFYEVYFPNNIFRNL